MHASLPRMPTVLAAVALAISGVPLTSDAPAAARERCLKVNHEHYVADSGHTHHWWYFATTYYQGSTYIVSVLEEHDQMRAKNCGRDGLRAELSGTNGELTDPYYTAELVEQFVEPAINVCRPCGAP